MNYFYFRLKFRIKKNAKFQEFFSNFKENWIFEKKVWKFGLKCRSFEGFFQNYQKSFLKFEKKFEISEKCQNFKSFFQVSTKEIMKESLKIWMKISRISNFFVTKKLEILSRIKVLKFFIQISEFQVKFGKKFESLKKCSRFWRFFPKISKDFLEILKKSSKFWQNVMIFKNLNLFKKRIFEGNLTECYIHVDQFFLLLYKQANVACFWIRRYIHL